jgi:signal peptidase I
VFETPARAEGVCGVTGTYVQRIVGLPGERVELRLVAGREHVFVDGRKLEEAYVGESRRGFGSERVFRVPDGHYFMLGDNRSSTCDSRVWGTLPRGRIVGEVVFTYWPPTGSASASIPRPDPAQAASF